MNQKIANELLKVAESLVAAGEGPLEIGGAGAGRGKGGYPSWEDQSKWRKEARRVSPKKISPSRAKELIRNHSSPMKPGYEFGMTQAVYSYVLRVWDKLPNRGTHSFNSTMVAIAKGKAPNLNT